MNMNSTTCEPWLNLNAESGARMKISFKYIILLFLLVYLLWAGVSPMRSWLSDAASKPDLVGDTASDEVVGKPTEQFPVSETASRGIAERTGTKHLADAHSASYYLIRADNPFSMREFVEDQPASEALPPAKRTKSSLMLTALDALSPKEAQWLFERGYPKEADYIAFLENRFSQAELAERAARNDLAALAMLGSVQLRDGQVMAGYANLEEAAVRGSVLALVEMARAQARHGDPLASYGLMQAALLRGDDLAVSLSQLPTDTWNALSLHNKLRASTYALHYLNNIARIRQRMGLPPLDNSVRPPRVLPPSNVSVPLGLYDYP
jgi:hypothetical protein